MEKNKPSLASMFVKLPSLVKSDFEDALKSSGLEKVSMTQAIIALLKNFNQLSTKQRKLLLGGDSLGFEPTEILVNYISNLQIGEHWFQSKFWIPAIETYENLYNQSEQFPIIQNWTRYKLGYAWFEVAYERRHHCLKFLSDSNFDLAIEEQILAIRSIAASMDYTLKALDSGILSNIKLIVLFNLACANSLMAHFLIERSILEQDKLFSKRNSQALRRNLKQLAKAKMENELDVGVPIESVHHSVAVEAFDQVLKKDPSSEVADKIRSYCEQSFQFLENIYDSLGEKEKTVNISWLIQRMYDDVDLGFLRDSKYTSARFWELEKRLSLREKSSKKWCNDKLDKLSKK